MQTSTPARADSRRPHAGMLSGASLMHQSDECLVALARSGSERAWSEITRRYRRQLRSYCERFVGASRAEDAVQQTFLQAFLALRDGAEREIALRAWLYRIAHNCSIDLLRKGSPDYDQLDLEYDGVAQPPMLFEQREDIRRLVARMRDLPDAQRQALALRELEGRSYEEISAQLGHSGSGVRQLIFRARTTLRNGVAGLVPFGLLKARLPQPSAYDLHHVATAAAVPASSGNGFETVSAATLAVVAVLGGGFAATDASSRRPKPAPAQMTGTAPAPAAPLAGAPPATSPGRASDLRGVRGVTVRLPGRNVARLGAAPTPIAVPVAGAQVPVPIVPTAVAPAGAPVQAPVPAAVAPVADPESVRLQSGPPTGPDAGSFASGSGSPAPPAPRAKEGTTVGAPAAPVSAPKQPGPGRPVPKPATPGGVTPKPSSAKAPAKPGPLASPPKSQAPKTATPPKSQPPKLQPAKRPPAKAPQVVAPKRERR